MAKGLKCFIFPSCNALHCKSEGIALSGTARMLRLPISLIFRRVFILFFPAKKRGAAFCFNVQLSRIAQNSVYYSLFYGIIYTETHQKKSVIMRNILEQLKTFMPLSGADTLNCEGFPAWSMDDSARLEQLAMTGTLTPSFYVNTSVQIFDALTLLERADADELAKAIVKGRNEGFIRTFPILGLAVLSKKDPEKFKEAFPQIIKTGNDLEDFINIIRHMRGMGRSIKSALHSYLEKNVTPYYAMKYRRQLADAIRLSRFAGSDPIYAYILKHYSSVAGTDITKAQKVYELYPEFAARKEFLHFLENKDYENAARVMLQYRLDVDSLSAYYARFDKTLWEAAAVNAPLMKFLKYLAKFQREGVELDGIIREKLSIPALKAAKIFPFRLYSAYKALRENKSLTAEFLQELLDEYTLAYDWSSFNKHSWIIAPDVSGSMKSPIGDSAELTYSEVSGMFTGFFNKGLDNVKIIPWSSEIHSCKWAKTAPVAEQMAHLDKMTWGSTYMEVPVEYMIENNIIADWSIFITDTEEYGTGWFACWQQYRKINPNAKAILLRLDPYNTTPFPPADAEAYGIWQVFGWNTNVIEYIKFIIERN